ncbi:hypothetical protein [Gordonia sp. CNJ-863]|uniref:hypothetical protein n=1 Tax=Gordonia sp. CNJ-863 TaxID=1904963 RepID=UPI00111534C8|nr:hypothetical protein [Gordonia sp. CNJ-863]
MAMRAQPLAGFDYSLWFSCAACGTRIAVGADEYSLQEAGEMAYPGCSCGCEIDISSAQPVIRSVDDPVVDDVAVDQVEWYHSSCTRDWPNAELYRASLVSQLAASALPTSDVQQMLTWKTGLALHLGTYEAAVENMLRRAADQDDPRTTRYWLHRVRLRLAPGDLHPHVTTELVGAFGDVELARVHELGARVVRYVNTREAAGSLSLAIDPSVIGEVSTIAIPVATAADGQAEASSRAAAAAVSALNQLGPRPDTAGFSDIDLNPVMLEIRAANPDDPHDIACRVLARRLEEHQDRSHIIWSRLTGQLTRDYLYEVNSRVRGAFLEAVQPQTDPHEYHDRFRITAGLLTHPSDVMTALRKAPRRTIECRGGSGRPAITDS